MSQRLTCAVMASTGLCDLENNNNDDLDKTKEAAAAFSDIFAEEVFDEKRPLLRSLGCQDNRTLNFYLIDKVTQWSLLQHLGVLDSRSKNLEELGSNSPDLPKAIIVSLLDEKVFAMEDDPADGLTLESLKSFVRTFHDNVNQLKVLKQSKVLQKDLNSEEVEKSNTAGGIREMNANNFAETIAIATQTTPGNN